jgi:hypothetical protein
MDPRENLAAGRAHRRANLLNTGQIQAIRGVDGVLEHGSIQFSQLCVVHLWHPPLRSRNTAPTVMQLSRRLLYHLASDIEELHQHGFNSGWIHE